MRLPRSLPRLALPAPFLPAPQVSTSAFEACQQQHWPQLFGGLAPAEQQRVMAGLRQARPRLVKGYEAMAMARLILEDDRWGSL